MKLKKILMLTMLLTISIVASLLDSLVPIPVLGVKLGIGNIVVLLMIYKFSVKETLLVLILRVLVVSFIRGNFLSLPFYMSISGAMSSFIIMYSLSKVKVLSVITVSVFGALFHCIGQIVVAVFTFGSINILYYLPIMMILSILTGILTGYIAIKLINNYENFSKVETEV